MNDNEIRLFDDSVIKLTIKQGTEAERFGISTINAGGNVIKDGVSINLFDFEDINSVSGCLVSGEMGYTRDTNRLFVGNISENFIDNGGTFIQQQTLGGVLSGNKYLGFIDSRKDPSSKNNGAPIPLNEMLTEPQYRTYNFVNNNNEQIQTHDGQWQKLPYYNEKYNAYDGDYMYDAYRNALIIFDHNIKKENDNYSATVPSNTIGGKRKTPLTALYANDKAASKEVLNSFTSDMYGDGYYLFYNVIPDGDTLTFAGKNFEETGAPNTEDFKEGNYSYNIIKLNSIPTDILKARLDDNFKIEGDKITLVGGGSDIQIENVSSSKIIINDANGKLVQSNYDVEKLGLFITKSDLEAKLGEYVTSTYLKANYYTREEVETKLKTLSNGASGGSAASTMRNFSYPFYAARDENGNTYSFAANATISPSTIASLMSVTTDDVMETPYYLLVKSTTEFTLTSAVISYDETDDENSTIEEIVSTIHGPILLPIGFSDSKEYYKLSVAAELLPG